MFRIYGQGTLQNCEESKAFFSLNQSFNHFRVPPGAVGSKTKRIKRKISRNILLRYVLCQVLGRLSPSPNSLTQYSLWAPVTPGLSCDKVSLMRARNYPRLIVAHIPRPSLTAVAAVVLLDVFARLMLCPLWLPWLWTESRAGASFSMWGSPIFQYANWIKFVSWRD